MIPNKMAYKSCAGAVWVEFAIVTIILMTILLGVNMMLGRMAVTAQDYTVDAQSGGVVCTRQTLKRLRSSDFGPLAEEGCL